MPASTSCLSTSGGEQQGGALPLITAWLSGDAITVSALFSAKRYSRIFSAASRARESLLSCVLMRLPNRRANSPSCGVRNALRMQFFEVVYRARRRNCSVHRHPARRAFWFPSAASTEIGLALPMPRPGPIKKRIALGVGKQFFPCIEPIGRAHDHAFQRRRINPDPPFSARPALPALPPCAAPRARRVASRPS